MGRRYIADTQRQHRQRNREQAVQYLQAHPCVDCGEADLRVLDFDHVSGTKSFNIGRAISGSHRSWDSIMKEIGKCVVRCANCHRKKTATEQGWHSQFKHP